ncbi:cell division protein ZipA [Pseudoalteromonas sp. SSDWG2]|uniref:cell division protein ZipA n=1 Tax=Pseudoalteromonas sp. SSDWG2 TaxID=3139391 RepID=UPI003BAADC73
MAEDLRWVLILISALVIGGLLIHGLWSVRKRTNAVENQPAHKQAPDIKEPATEQPPASAQPQSAPAQPSIDTEREEPSFSALDENEPSIGSFDFDEDAGDNLEPAQATSSESEPEVQPEDFVIIHVHMPEGLQMQGAKLLPLVLTLGFKYSDDGFFHRHEQASGQGPILFRMVNMYNPGTFDIDNMEQFSTAGVSLFMTLPNEGEAMATFNMLHSAAKKLADEFGAQLLDHQREPLSVNTVREYVEKVREYA